jgi:hydroxyacylglutathione hydrolase
MGGNVNHKAKMKFSNRVIKIPIVPFGMVNAHLIQGERGCILVDAGLPRSEKKIQRALQSAGLSFKDIKLIVVTHAHIDHAGSAASMRELSGSPIVVHAGDAMHYSGEIPMTFCPTGWFGRVFLKTGLPTGSYKSFAPDILLSGTDSFDLQEYGFQGHIRSTPGHTAGSISVELSDQDALVGDLLASGILLGGIALKGRAKRPPFEDDPMSVARELQRMVDSGMTQFYMGHGGPLPAKEVRRHIASLVKSATKSNQQRKQRRNGEITL